MSYQRPKLIVLTGGPGSGKTSVIEHLRKAGHPCNAEAGRRIIQEQRMIDGPALPWRDRALYAEVMLSWELRALQDRQGTTGSVFCDRGIPDVIGYLRLEGLPVPPHMMRAARRCRYAGPVFLFPPWPEIYGRDEERRQTFETAEATHRAMAAVYAELGYDLIEVPRVPVAERMAFLLATVEGLC